MSLENEIALVTGASRGIGLAIALELGRQGATVVGTATSSDGAEKISKALKENGIKGEGMALDVTDPASIEALLTAMQKSPGAPTILVNNAGITRDNLLMRMKDEDWDAIMETNLKSVYRMSKACIRAMTKARKGRIISIASVVGSIGNAGQANYAAAKAGVMGFTRALPDEQKALLLQQIPLGRLGLPEEIAAAVGFLASPQAAYITGTTIHVNGGMFMN